VKLQIGDKQYDYQTAAFKAPLTRLMELKTAGGVGPRSIRKMIVDIFGAESDEVREEIQDDVATMLAMQSLVFLCYRLDDDTTIGFNDIAVGYSDLAWIVEDGDVPDAPDPTTATPGDQTPPSDETVNEPKPNAPKRPPRTSKTSKSPSTPTS
jgi:hypothetical protein